MSTYRIPDFLYNKKIYKYVESLVSEGETSYSSLEMDKKEYLVTLIIDVLGNDAYDLLTGSDNLDKTLTYLSRFLKTANKEDAYDLLHQIKSNAIEQYSYNLDELFSEIISDNQDEYRRENGLVSFINYQTGEVEWRKRA